AIPRRPTTTIRPADAALAITGSGARRDFGHHDVSLASAEQGGEMAAGVIDHRHSRILRECFLIAAPFFDPPLGLGDPPRLGGGESALTVTQFRDASLIGWRLARVRGWAVWLRSLLANGRALAKMVLGRGWIWPLSGPALLGLD